MGNRWCVIEEATGLVVNAIVWDGIAEWSPPEGCIVLESEVAGPGWTYGNGQFYPPAVAPPTPEEVLASQSAKLQSLKAMAEAQKAALTARIGVINEAIEYEMATPEEEAELPTRVSQRKEWGQYAVLLGRVTSQVGWPPDVQWPAPPAAGMDLSVSSVANPLS